MYVAYNFVSKEPKVTVTIRPIREFFAERLPSVSGAEGKSWVDKKLSSRGGKSFEISYNF